MHLKCYNKYMRLRLLGTGTSHGVPVIGCDCKVCTSTDKRDKRFRSSAYITTDDNKHILIDCGPEFRMQCLANNIKKVDAVLLTHSHADHFHGIDDLRIFSCDMFRKPVGASETVMAQYNAPPIPIYTNKITVDDMYSRFSYIFKSVTEGGGHARLNPIVAEEQFTYGQTIITPVPMMHGHLATTGWLLTEIKNSGERKSIAYLTDCSYISQESIDLIRKNAGNLEHLVIDGLRIRPHSTHFSFLEALSAAEQIEANHVWLTHINHDSSHEEIISYIQEHLKEFPGLLKSQSVLPAYDQLDLES